MLQSLSYYRNGAQQRHIDPIFCNKAVILYPAKPEIGDKWAEQVDSKYKVKSNEGIEWKIKGWLEEWYNNQNIIND